MSKIFYHKNTGSFFINLISKIAAETLLFIIITGFRYKLNKLQLRAVKLEEKL